MKIAVIFSFLISGILSLSAQVRLESRLNMFRAGDEIVKQQVQYKDPGRAGENVLWDFSKLNIVNNEYVLMYDTIGGFITGKEHNTWYYYSISGDSLLCHGYENSTTMVKNECPELLLRFPVNYGDSTFSYYSGNGRYCDRLKISAMGTISSKVDACGTMILPDGDTLKNVLRVHTVKKISENLESVFLYREKTPEAFISTDSVNYRLATDTLLLELDTYRWYMAGYRYPVFETVKSISNNYGRARDFFSTAFFYPIKDHSYLDNDPENRDLLRSDTENDNQQNPDPWSGLSYNCYPNPASNDLNIEAFMPKSGRENATD